MSEAETVQTPIPMLLWCPACRARHVDEGEFVTKIHHTHACQNCGLVWRPALVATVGVQFLPGFKDGMVEPSRIIHHLTNGFATCGKKGMPNDWPQGHRWSHSWQVVTCFDCILASSETGNKETR